MAEPSGGQILLLLRGEKAKDWESLCMCLGVNPDEKNTSTYLVAKVLEELVAAGLVEVEGPLDSQSFHFPAGVIRLTRAATKVQHALGVSLPDIARMRRGQTMVISPFFGAVTPAETARLDIFMLMPFTPELHPVYEDHIKRIVSTMSLEIRRADDFFGAHEIMKDIWRCIVGATIVIADCTGRNPNVFYEIGIAHTLGKPVILITQNKDDVPFDLRAIRFIEYKYTPRGMTAFEKALQSAIEDTVPITVAQRTGQ